MTTDTEDDGFTTVHQSAAFAGAGAGGVVRPDLPLTLSAAQAEILALRGQIAALREALYPFAETLSRFEFAENQLLLLSEDNPKGRRLAHLLPEQFRRARDVQANTARRALTNGGDNG